MPGIETLRGCGIGYFLLVEYGGIWKNGEVGKTIVPVDFKLGKFEFHDTIQ